LNIRGSVIALLLTLAAASGLASAQTPSPEMPATQLPAPAPGITPEPSTPSPTGRYSWLTRWFDPATAPFIPVPEIAADPDSGTTLGLLMVKLKTDDNHSINRIIAPDVLHNPYFGYGAHARVYAYPSPDVQWSVLAGIKQRVEREFEAEYESGRVRDKRWSITGSVIYDRDGTPRFFGIGNRTRADGESNYTNQQELAQLQVGLNLTHAWQLLYTGRLRVVDVQPGTLNGVASLDERYGDIVGVGTNHEFLNRVSIVYDTRNDLTVPSEGVKLVAYGGLASRAGILNDTLYSEAGFDGRFFWPVVTDTVIAAHTAIRYMPTAHRAPFWALSSIGGGESQIGGEQPLRGYGQGRYYDRDSFSTSVEVRRTVMSLNIVATQLDIEVAPFVDVGRVFGRTSVLPFERLHAVGGVGFRGIARPFVVGYVDIGYGTEGTAVFTGINYPF
jgi:hypothetical protein